MCTIPLITRRSSTRCAPRRPRGSNGSIRAHSESLSHVIPFMCKLPQNESLNHIQRETTTGRADRLAFRVEALYKYLCNDKRYAMANVVTINRPEVVALIEEAAKKLTDGNKTEAVALAVRRLLEQNARAGSLFGAHRGSVRVHEGVDLIAPALDVAPDAETGREVER